MPEGFDDTQLGKLAIPVEFDTSKSGEKLKADAKRVGRETGRLTQEEIRKASTEWDRKYARASAEESAKNTVRELKNQYRARIGEARAALVEGIIDPKEFEKRARTAARATNAAVLAELKNVQRGSAEFGIISQGFVNVEQSTRKATRSFSDMAAQANRGVQGVGEMRESLASLLAQAAGVHPVLGRITNVFGTMAMGSVLMAAVLGGMAAIAAGWRKITEDARETEKAHEDAIEGLKELQRQRNLGPAGELGRRAGVRSVDLAWLKKEMADRRRFLETGQAPEGVGQFWLPRAEAEIQKEIDELSRTLDVAWGKMGEDQDERQKDLRDREAANLAALVSANQATAEQLARARDIIARDQAELARLASGEQTEEVVQRRADLLNEVKQMQAAFESAGSDAKKERERQAKEAEQSLERLELAAARQRELGPLASRLGLTAEAIPDSVAQKLRAIVKLEGEIAQLEKDAALLGGKAPPEAAEFIEGQRRVLRELREEVARSLPGLQEASKALGEMGRRVVLSDTPFAKQGGGVGFVNQSFAEMSEQLREIIRLEEERDRALLTRNPARLAEAEERLKDARGALRDYTADLAANLERAGLPAKKLKELLAQIAKILADAGIDIKDLGEGMSKWEQYGRMTTVLARGLLSVADATGQISDQARRAVSGLLDVLDGIEQIKRANDSPVGFDQALGFASGGMALLGGAASIVSAIGGIGARAEQRQEEVRKQLAENARRLQENTQALQDFREAALSDVSGEERDKRTAFWEKAIRPTLDAGDGSADDIRRNGAAWGLEKLARDSGKTVAEVEDFLNWLEKQTGSEFFDLESDTLDIYEMRKAWDEFVKKGLGGFDDTLGGALDAMQFRWQIFGDAAGDAAAKLDEFIATVRKFDKAGAFADALQEALASGGAEGANAFVDELARRYAEGDQSLFAEGGIFYGLTGEEVRRLLEEGNGLIEDMIARGPGGTTQDFVQARSITEITGSRIEDALYSLDAMAAKGLDLSLERNDLLRQLLGGRALDPGSVSPASFAPPVAVGAGSSVHIENSFDVRVDGCEAGGLTVAAQVQAGVRDAMSEVFSPAGLRKIDKGLGGIGQQKLRGAGRLR